MEKINCRGHENRIELCKKFIIKPQFRIKILKGIVISDAGGRISNELYVFSAYNKTDNSFYGKITCGETVAKDFLEITGEHKPSLFNMLKPVKRTADSNSLKKAALNKTQAERKTTVTVNTTNWHPVNRALYEAIMILIIVWQDTSGDSLLFREMNKCCKYPDKYPYSDRLIRVNTMISKDRRKTLANILDSLKRAGNDLRDFDLSLLHDAVLKTGVESHIL